jgi:Arylsulfotransferase (ASST)
VFQLRPTEMSSVGAKLTRRRLVALAGAAFASLLGPRVAVGETGSTSPAAETATGGRYVSRPDLNPPPVTISVPAEGTAPGYVFLAPFDISAAGAPAYSTPASESHVGPLIVDNSGEPVWFLPMSKQTAMGLRVQTFKGRRVLTWYEGTVLGAYGGDFVIFDPTYHEVARVRAGRGRHGDLHEFRLTRSGTALISIYQEVNADLSSIGGPSDGRLVEGIVQEIDVASGRVLFEWNSRDHVGLDESYRTGVTPQGNVDYFHLNSVDVDFDGNLLISARHTCAVYKVGRRSGKVIWRLGGKKSDFSIDDAASFSYQHDVRRHADGQLTIFDNAAADPGPGVASRGVRIALDMRDMRASLVREYRTDDARAGWAMGNVQQLGDGGAFVGWGTDGSFSEFGPGGDLRFDARLGDGTVDYRAFRFPWVAHPTGEPAVGVRQNADGTLTAYASWNGSTEVATWQVRTGPSPQRHQAVAEARRAGFETAITVPAAGGYLTVAALDASGRRLGLATPIPIPI